MYVQTRELHNIFLQESCSKTIDFNGGTHDLCIIPVTEMSYQCVNNYNIHNQIKFIMFILIIKSWIYLFSFANHSPNVNIQSQLGN